MRKILLACGSRANWGSLAAIAPVLRARARLVVLCYASALSARHGRVVDDIEAAGYDVIRAATLVEGDELEDMAAVVGLTMPAAASAIVTHRPELVYVVGDRYEVLPVAYAAALLNVPVAHQMGGELSGTIDESIRHAITKLSHWHFAATATAADRIMAMGEDPTRVWVSGCPRIDSCRDLPPRERSLIISQHPVTTEVDQAAAQMAATLRAVAAVGYTGPVHLFWPNVDAGAGSIVAHVRWTRDTYRTHRNLSVREYMALLASADCIVGNSSSAIREAAFLGTPCVNVGSRQQWRERGPNVIDVDHDTDAIAGAIRAQLDHGAYPRDTLYGDGHAAERIVEVLAAEPLPAAQKVWSAC